MIRPGLSTSTPFFSQCQFRNVGLRRNSLNEAENILKCEGIIDFEEFQPHNFEDILCKAK